MRNFYGGQERKDLVPWEFTGNASGGRSSGRSAVSRKERVTGLGGMIRAQWGPVPAKKPAHGGLGGRARGRG